jgi:heat shock protein HtpX
MILTMFLLFAVYLAFIGALWSANYATFLPLMGVFVFVQFFFSDRLALYSMGASTVEPQEYPQLHRMIERLSQQADLPKPAVAVADSDVPNAFATGRSQKNSTVAVTTGLLRTLDADELEGVIAHELAHVKNRDVMVMTIASFLSTVAFMIVRMGFWFGGGRSRQGGSFIVALLASLAVWIISFLLIRALSRYREFAADRGAALITGDPGALASALRSIDGRIDKVPQRDLREQAEMNAFFIIPITSGFLGRLFRTHPPTDRRISRLNDLAVELERA